MSLATGKAVISPAQCGGLIEASMTFSSSFFMDSISPAQCGGLIEALDPRRVMLIGKRDFPRAMRGPH